MGQKRLSHTDAAGQIRMVDVSRKQTTVRTAVANCHVQTINDSSVPLASVGDLDPLLAARLAGVLAAKQTGTLVPLCHPLTLDQVLVDVTPAASGYDVTSTVVCTGRTGVEMEALTACAMAALSLVGSLRAIDPMASVSGLVLERKSGGRSGEWGRAVSTPSEGPRDTTT